MKTLKIFSVFALIFILLCTASCKRRKSLAELRREEREAIAQFIRDSTINVFHEQLPVDTVFLNENDFILRPASLNSNDFYLRPSGLYIHVADTGDGIPPKEGETVFVRFDEMTLQGNITLNQWPDEFVLRNGSTFAQAFTEAASFMGDEGEAFLIVPSSIGSANAQQNITPYYYHIRTRIR